MKKIGNKSPAPPLIAIDGLGAAGKSTVGKIVARKLGYRFIDTGEMYRALTWLAIHLGVNTGDEPTLSKLASEAKIEIGSSSCGERQPVTINGIDITEEVYSSEVEAEVSKVSKVAGVRTTMVAHQRRMAESGKLVMAGRDIGTVVLPHAGLKVFLEASAEERAKRRYQEERGMSKVTYDDILAELRRRDTIDSSRALSPTKPAPDAKKVDTEGLGPQEVAERILALAKEAG